MALPANWVAGPQSAPIIKRSQYLADALKGLQEGSKDIRSKGELATRLLANAILQGSVERTNRDMASAQNADLTSEAKATVNLLSGGASQGAPAATAAPSIPIAPKPADIPATVAPAAPVQQAPLPPAVPQANRSDVSAPLDVRQNNPGNIRDTSIPWRGATGALGGFEVFDTPENGIRAAARNLMTYGDKGVNTADGIANRWAPPNENDTKSYAQYLASVVGDGPLNMKDAGTLAPLVSAIIQRENGQNPYSPDVIRNGVMAALGGGQQAQAPQPPMAMAAQGMGGPTPAPGPAMQGQPPQGAPMPPQANPGLPQAMPAQASATLSPGGGMAPAAPAPSGAVGAAPSRGPTPEQIQLYQRMMASGQPEQIAAARQFAMRLQQEAAQAPEYDTTVTRGGQVVRVDKRTGQTQVMDVPGFRQQLSGNLQYGPDNRAAPIPGTEARIMSAQQLGINAPPGTMFSVDPSGKPSPLAAPPDGYRAVGPQGELAPVAGGEKDPNSVANRLTFLREFRTEVKPILDKATDLKRNVSAVRTGYAQQNGSGDIAMVNGLQKLIDEGVVREGDVALQLSAQGIKGGLAGLTGFLQSSGKFDPQIRSKILDTANQLYGSLNSTYKDRALGYRGIVERSFGPGAFGDVVPMETISALGWDGKPEPDGATVPSANNGAAVSRGMDGEARRRDYQAALAEKARREALKAGRR